MGGAVAIKIHRKNQAYWDGAILVAPMCKVVINFYFIFFTWTKPGYYIILLIYILFEIFIYLNRLPKKWDHIQ